MTKWTVTPLLLIVVVLCNPHQFWLFVPWPRHCLHCYRRGYWQSDRPAKRGARPSPALPPTSSIHPLGLNMPRRVNFSLMKVYPGSRLKWHHYQPLPRGAQFNTVTASSLSVCAVRLMSIPIVRSCTQHCLLLCHSVCLCLLFPATKSAQLDINKKLKSGKKVIWRPLYRHNDHWSGQGLPGTTNAMYEWVSNKSVQDHLPKLI